MRICVVSEREFGNGASISAHRLAEGFHEAGHDVHYIYSIDAKLTSKFGFKKYKLGRPLKRYDIYRKYKKANIFTKFALRIIEKKLWKEDLKLIFDKISKIQPDIINLHNVGSILKHHHVVELSKICPVVWTMHDQYPVNLYHNRWQNIDGTTETTWELDFNEPPSDKFLNQMLNSKANISFVCPSQWLKNIADKILEDRFKTYLIRNGVSEIDFYPENKNSVREELGLPKDVILALFMSARLDYNLKNLNTVLEATKDLSKKVKIIALGKPGELKWDQDNLIQKDLVIDQNLTKKYLNACDLLVVPSLVENLPNTILESFMCGRPVAASNVGGIPEVVKGNFNGWIIKDNSQKEWQKVISEIISEIDDKQSIQILSYAKENFEITKIGQKYLALFECLISNVR